MGWTAFKILGVSIGKSLTTLPGGQREVHRTFGTVVDVLEANVNRYPIQTNCKEKIRHLFPALDTAPGEKKKKEEEERKKETLDIDPFLRNSSC